MFAAVWTRDGVCEVEVFTTWDEAYESIIDFYLSDTCETRDEAVARYKNSGYEYVVKVADRRGESRTRQVLDDAARREPLDLVARLAYLRDRAYAARQARDEAGACVIEDAIAALRNGTDRTGESR